MKIDNFIKETCFVDVEAKWSLKMSIKSFWREFFLINWLQLLHRCRHHLTSQPDFQLLIFLSWTLKSIWNNSFFVCFGISDPNQNPFKKLINYGRCFSVANEGFIWNRLVLDYSISVLNSNNDICVFLRFLMHWQHLRWYLLIWSFRKFNIWKKSMW